MTIGTHNHSSLCSQLKSGILLLLVLYLQMGYATNRYYYKYEIKPTKVVIDDLIGYDPMKFSIDNIYIESNNNVSSYNVSKCYTGEPQQNQISSYDIFPLSNAANVISCMENDFNPAAFSISLSGKIFIGETNCSFDGVSPLVWNLEILGNDFLNLSFSPNFVTPCASFTAQLENNGGEIQIFFAIKRTRYSADLENDITICNNEQTSIIYNPNGADIGEWFVKVGNTWTPVVYHEMGSGSNYNPHISSEGNLVVEGGGEFKYSYTTSDMLCPSISDEIAINTSDQNVSFSQDDIYLCENSSVNLQPTILGPGNITWHYSSDNVNFSIIPDEQSSVLIASSPGYYMAKLNNNGCTSQDIVQIHINPLPQVDFNQYTTQPLLISKGAGVVLSPSQVQYGYQYNWSTGETEPQIYIDKDGYYQVTVMNPSTNCYSTSGIYVQYDGNSVHSDLIKPVGSILNRIEVPELFSNKSSYIYPLGVVEVNDYIQDNPTSLEQQDIIVYKALARLNYHGNNGKFFGLKENSQNAQESWAVRVWYRILDAKTGSELYNDPGRDFLTISSYGMTPVFTDLRKYDISTSSVRLEVVNIEYYASAEDLNSNLPTQPSTAISQYIAANLELEMQINYLPYFDKNSQISNSDISAVLDNASNRLLLNWPYIHGAYQYDIEFAHSEAILTNSNDILKLFKEKGFNVNTKLNNYSYVLTFPKGEIYYRIRPVGYAQSMQTDEGFIYGKWSLVNANTRIHVEDKVLSDNLHWESTITFAEEGKKKQVVSYYDNTLRNQQTVTHLSSENLSLYAESKYDREGRPVISILPAPVSSQSINFVQGLNKSINNTEYDFNVFDYNTVEELNSLKFSNLTGASKYYSSQNDFFTTNSYKKSDLSVLPDANGFVASQLRYTRDGTGRIAEQSGIGEKFTLGSQTSKTTRYFYSTPSQKELYQMFGHNIGHASRYQKNMVIDPNGQASISYLDLSDKTLATCLAGKAPDNLEELDEYAEEETIYVIDKQKNMISSDGLSINLTESILNVKNNNIYEFEYDITGAVSRFSLDDKNNEIQTNCKGCSYVLDIEVYDPNGFPVVLTDLQTTNLDESPDQAYLVSSGECTPDCYKKIANLNVVPKVEENICGVGVTTNKYAKQTISFKATFKELGSYTLHKKLRLAETWKQEFINEIKQKPEYTINGNDDVITEIDNIVCDEKIKCEMDCESMIVIQPNESEQDYQRRLLACKETFCGKNNPQTYMISRAVEMQCKSILDQIRLQMSPGGYFYESSVDCSGGINGICFNDILDILSSGDDNYNVDVRYGDSYERIALSELMSRILNSNSPQLDINEDGLVTQEDMDEMKGDDQVYTIDDKRRILAKYWIHSQGYPGENGYVRGFDDILALHHREYGFYNVCSTNADLREAYKYDAMMINDVNQDPALGLVGWNHALSLHYVYTDKFPSADNYPDVTNSQCANISSTCKKDPAEKLIYLYSHLLKHRFKNDNGDYVDLPLYEYVNPAVKNNTGSNYQRHQFFNEIFNAAQLPPCNWANGYTAYYNGLSVANKAKADIAIWNMYLGIYSHEKSILLSNWHKNTKNLTYYIDQYAIVQNPALLSSQTRDEIREDGIAELQSSCQGTCDINAKVMAASFLTYYIRSGKDVSIGNQTIPAAELTETQQEQVTTAIATDLRDRCLLSCEGDQLNPFGLFISTDPNKDAPEYVYDIFDQTAFPIGNGNSSVTFDELTSEDLDDFFRNNVTDVETQTIETVCTPNDCMEQLIMQLNNYKMLFDDEEALIQIVQTAFDNCGVTPELEVTGVQVDEGGETPAQVIITIGDPQNGGCILTYQFRIYSPEMGNNVLWSTTIPTLPKLEKKGLIRNNTSQTAPFTYSGWAVENNPQSPTVFLLPSTSNSTSSNFRQTNSSNNGWVFDTTYIVELDSVLQAVLQTDTTAFLDSLDNTVTWLYDEDMGQYYFFEEDDDVMYLAMLDMVDDTANVDYFYYSSPDYMPLSARISQGTGGVNNDILDAATNSSVPDCIDDCGCVRYSVSPPTKNTDVDGNPYEYNEYLELVELGLTNGWKCYKKDENENCYSQYFSAEIFAAMGGEDGWCNPQGEIINYYVYYNIDGGCNPFNNCVNYTYYRPVITEDLADIIPVSTTKCDDYKEILKEHAIAKQNDIIWNTIATEVATKSIPACMNVNERMQYTCISGQYHYTLYYYDQAGNLVMTVPPEGVKLIPDNNLIVDDDGFLVKQQVGGMGNTVTANPQHTLATNYIYNTRNQVVRQVTPDAGITRFWYNDKGQLRFSQNAKQAVENLFSYTIYDEQGRIREVGEYDNKKYSELIDVQLRDYFQGDFSGIDFSKSGLVSQGGISVDVTNKVVLDSDFPLDFPRLDEVWSVLSDNPVSFCNQQTFTTYDLPVQQYGITSRNTRNRVSTTIVKSGDIRYNSTNNNYLLTNSNNSIYYDYDEVGNVQNIFIEYGLSREYRQNPESTDGIQYLPVKMKFYKVHYDYDLISGKVNAVEFREGDGGFLNYKQDVFFRHRYEYDDDNRITAVYTTKDGVIEECEARYFYYPHGPLARVEYGKNNVQGIDYVYTLQGWLKGINSPNINKNFGTSADNYALTHDAFNFSNPSSEKFKALHKLNGADEFMYQIGYYKGDYTPIGSSASTVDAGNMDESENLFAVKSAGDPAVEGNDLFNGNIAYTLSTIAPSLHVNQTTNPGFVPDAHTSKVTDALTQQMQYKYDQLNRIISTNTIQQNFDNGFTPLQVNHKYDEIYEYDANGNIKKLLRYAPNTQYSAANTSSGQPNLLLDDLTYNYYPESNKLKQVTDAVNGSNPSHVLHPFGPDVDIAPGQGTNNYKYDKIGNLTTDLSEDIVEEIAGQQKDGIVWNVYGKIQEIKFRSDKSDLEFLYDATGNRIAKISKPKEAGQLKSPEHYIYTWYVRDAQGNVLFTETQTPESSNVSEFTADREYNIYGSSRIGIQKERILPQSHSDYYTSLLANNQYQRKVGLKFYELSNHLGNVMVTVSDKLLGYNTGISGNDASLPAERVLADVQTAQDYYPFGMIMPVRNYVKSECLSTVLVAEDDFSPCPEADPEMMSSCNQWYNTFSSGISPIFTLDWGRLEHASGQRLRLNSTSMQIMDPSSTGHVAIAVREMDVVPGMHYELSMDVTEISATGETVAGALVVVDKETLKNTPPEQLFEANMSRLKMFNDTTTLLTDFQAVSDKALAIVGVYNSADSIYAQIDNVVFKSFDTTDLIPFFADDFQQSPDGWYSEFPNAEVALFGATGPNITGDNELIFLPYGEFSLQNGKLKVTRNVANDEVIGVAAREFRVDSAKSYRIGLDFASSLPNTYCYLMAVHKQGIYPSAGFIPLTTNATLGDGRKYMSFIPQDSVVTLLVVAMPQNGSTPGSYFTIDNLFVEEEIPMDTPVVNMLASYDFSTNPGTSFYNTMAVEEGYVTPTGTTTWQSSAENLKLGFASGKDNTTLLTDFATQSGRDYTITFELSDVIPSFTGAMMALNIDASEHTYSGYQHLTKYEGIDSSGQQQFTFRATSSHSTFGMELQHMGDNSDYYFLIDNFAISESDAYSYDTLYENAGWDTYDEWRNIIIPPVQTSETYAYNEVGKVVWDDSCGCLRLEDRATVYQEGSEAPPYVSYGQKDFYLAANTPYRLSYEVKDWQDTTEQLGRLFIFSKEMVQQYNFASFAMSSSLLAQQDITGEGMYHLTFSTPYAQYITVTFAHAGMTEGYMAIDHVSLQQYGSDTVMYESFDTTIAPWRSSVLPAEEAPALEAGTLTWEQDSLRLRITQGDFEMGGTALWLGAAAHNFPVQPYKQYRLRLDVLGDLQNQIEFSNIAEAAVSVYDAEAFAQLGPLGTEPITRVSFGDYGQHQSSLFRARSGEIVVLVHLISGKTQQAEAGVFYIDNLKLELVENSITYLCESSTPNTFIGGGYRFGFNGQEQEKEIGISHTSAEFWMYDARTAHRWNIDPVLYPWQSSYATFNNNPITYSDPLGNVATPLPNSVATSLVNSYKINKTTFKNIKIQDFESDLIQQLSDPSSASIPHYSGNYCALYAFSYVYSLLEPGCFSEAVKDLYSKGKANINGKNVNAPNSLQNSDLGKNKDNISAFILAASVRVNSNYVFPYSNSTDVWSVTLSSAIIDWLSNVANLQVTEYNYGYEFASDGITDIDLKDLQKSLNQEGVLAVLRLSYTQFYAPSSDDQADYIGGRGDIVGGDHYVVLNKINNIDFEKGTINFDYYDSHSSNKSKEMKLSKFKDMINHVIKVSKK